MAHHTCMGFEDPKDCEACYPIEVEIENLKADLAEAGGLLRGAEKFCGEETHMNQESAELCPDWLERRDALLRRVGKGE